MTVKRAFPIRQGYGTGLIGSVLMAGLVLAAPVAMGSEAGALVSRGEAATGSEASTSTPSTVPPWAQPCQPPLDCDAVRAQRIQRIRSGTLVRSMALVPGTVLEVYRDASGRLDVVERPRHVAADEDNGESPQAGVETVPGTVSVSKETARPLHRTEFSRDPNGNTATEGDFCFDCYDENYNALMGLLDHLEAAQKQVPPKSRLKKIGSFYESRAGVLIHEECFEQYGDQVEKWVTDAAVEGLNCHGMSEAIYNDRTGNRGKSYYSHIPRLVNLFTKDSQGRAFSGGALLNVGGKTEILQNPCEDYKSLPLNLANKIHKDNCEFDGRFDLTQPKIICQVDKFSLAVSEYDGSNNLANASVAAYATSPSTIQPVFLNWKGKTEVYNHPIISFVPRGRKLNEEQFKATFWHELLHNCGYNHGDEGHPDYTYFCAAACFSKSYNFSESTVQGARGQCEKSNRDNTSHSQLDDIRRIIGSH